MSTIRISNLSTDQLNLSKAQLKTSPVNYISIPILAPSIRLNGKMKINKFDSKNKASKDSISLAIEVEEKDVKKLDEIEAYIQKEYANKKDEIQKLQNKFKIIPENLKILNENAIGKMIYAKIYMNDGNLSAKFFKKENGQKRPILHPLEFKETFDGEVIFQFSKIYIGKFESITLFAKAVLVDEIVEETFFDDIADADDYE